MTTRKSWARGLRADLTPLRTSADFRQELVGSYLADLAAMILAYPGSLIPFMAVTLHAPWSAGLMFSAMSAGAFAVSALSGWATRVRLHGLGIALGAGGLACVAAVGLICLLLPGSEGTGRT
jgi:hypothetical protein